MTIGNVAFQGVQFGVGYTSSSTQGILGVGYASNEADAAVDGRLYKNLPQQMADTGYIAANAYSLWLNDYFASQGSILFGGVDTAKFNGDLLTVPVLQEAGLYEEFIIALSGLSVDGTTLLTEENALPVLLDSGTSLTYLPSSVTDTLFSHFNTRLNNDAGGAVVNCNLAVENPSVNIVFSFSGATITVPLDEMVLENGIRRGKPVCILGITTAAEGQTPVLGDTFLRSAYVVYDLENNEISLAQTNFNATGTSNVMEIASGDNGVPGASPVASVVSVAVTGTSAPRIGGSTSTSTSTAAGVQMTAAPLAMVGGILAAAAVVGAMAL